MKTSSVFKYFPPPDFLNPPRIGISFSDQSVKAVAFGSGENKFPVESMLTHLDEGTVVSGSIVKPEKIISKFKEVAEKFDSKFVYFTVPDELTYIFNTTVKVVPGKDATENVAFTIEENVPLALADTVFDFVPKNVRKVGADFEAQMVVAASARKEIEKITDALKAAGLEPIGCIHESQAIAEALIPESSNTLFCIVHVREDRIGIFLTKGNTVSFSTIRASGPSTAIEDFRDEYTKMIEYHSRYDNSPLIAPIAEVIVCGEFEIAKSIVNAHNEAGKYKEKARLGNVWTNVFEIDEHTPNIPYEKSLSFAGSIGALLTSF